ncbi:MAG: MerR family transcriptional regulator [Microbacterium sp.]
MSIDRNSLFQIGEVTERVGLSLRTVRYYEEVGLVTPSARTDGGFRLYSEEDVQRLLEVKSMKAFDLTLEEMGRLLDLLDRSAAAHTLDTADLDQLQSELGEYASRAVQLLEKRKRELVDAEALRRTIVDRIAHLQATSPPAT